MGTVAVVIVSALAGAIVGSFVTVVVDRVPRGISVIRPPSRCRGCDSELEAIELVPVLSWLATRGTCRHCGARIGTGTLMIELTTIGVFVLFGLTFGSDPVLVAYWNLGAALIALSCIDLSFHRLPREITYTAFALSSIVIVVAALIDDDAERIWYAAVGAGLAFAIMAPIFLLSRGGMGDGDVRLAPLIGLHLGYISVALVPIGLMFGFALGAVVGVTLIVLGRAGRKTALPFGPFLAAGCIIAVVVGEPIVEAVWHG